MNEKVYLFARSLTERVRPKGMHYGMPERVWILRFMRRQTEGGENQMNFYDFINSQAIGSYCQEMGHEFTPIQAAYLVNSSHRHTLKEKHQAFCHIMEQMPDEETNARVRHTADGAVHRAGIRWLLSRYMEIQNRYLEKFFDNEDGDVYEYRVCCSGDYYNEDNYYPTIQSVFARIDEEPSSEEDVSLIQVCKRKTDGSGQAIRVSFNKEREVTDIDIEWEMSEEDQDILYGIDGVCFVCPVPFKKGDIVYAPFQSGIYPPHADREPFVLDYVWYEEEDEDYIARYSSSPHCCSADMVAYGYFQHPDGGLYGECMHDYLSLEYYPGPLDGKKRILKAVSNYLKGEIDLPLLLNAYYVLMGEENIKQNRERMNITKEGLRLAGLMEE